MSRKRYRFYGWSVEVREDSVYLRKGSAGIIIPLPIKYETFLVSRKWTSKRLRDFDSVVGGEEEGKHRDMDILTIMFRSGDREYLVHIMSYEGHVAVAHGFADWDGDIYGFHIEGVE